VETPAQRAQYVVRHNRGLMALMHAKRGPRILDTSFISTIIELDRYCSSIGPFPYRPSLVMLDVHLMPKVDILLSEGYSFHRRCE
jgi:hypothetical protein